MIARVSHISNFSNIAREHFASLLLIEKKFQNSKNEPEKDSLEADMGKEAMIVILFSTTAIEAYIYDYAARHFSDTFVRNYIDRLDILSKWVLVPYLITKKELPRDGEWFSLLKEIVRRRNSLTHHKSSGIPSNIHKARKYIENLHDESEEIVVTAKKSIRLLDLIVDAVTKNNPEEKPWIETYLKE